MSLELSYSEYGTGPPLVILHGLFGSARNWTTIAKQLAEAYHVYTLDLRNHGASPWASSMTYPEMADDVRAFLERHGLEGATLLGHSMGGKTAMLLALEHGRLVGRLIVADIAPVTYGHTQLPYVDAMLGADLGTATRRSEVDRQLGPRIPEAALRGFLLQNLVMEDGRLRWRINLGALAENMDVLAGYPAQPAGLSYTGPALFLTGALSDYVQPEHHALIRRLFPRARIDALPAAGHWLHAERPQEFVARLRSFLNAAPPHAQTPPPSRPR